MTTSPIRNALRAWISRSVRGSSQLRVQHLGLIDPDIESLRTALDRLADQLPLSFALDSSAGEIVIVERKFAERVGLQVLHALCEDRPMISVTGPAAGADTTLSALQRFERMQGELIEQLHALPALRARSEVAAALVAASRRSQWMSSGAAVASGFDSDFDSRLNAAELAVAELDEERSRVLAHLLRGLRDRNASPLVATYGPGASLRVDFARGEVRLDALAQQHLRVLRELPMLEPAAQTEPSASVRALYDTVWDFGLASAGFAPLGAPEDWWHAPLSDRGVIAIAQYTRAPRHLDLARRLLEGPATPAELRRHARVGVTDLRGFLQGCLFLGLVAWEGRAPRAGGR